MLYNVKINNKIVEHTTSFEWEDDLDKISSNFSFTSDEKFDVGSICTLEKIKNKTNVLKGIITSYTRTDLKNVYSYSGFDLGFYLDKNNIIQQFKGAKITDAITSLLKSNKIPIGSIPTFTGTVSKSYRNVVLSDIMKELLELGKVKTGNSDCYIDCRNGSFNIFYYNTNNFLYGLLAEVFQAKSTDTINGINISESMEEMKTRVIICDNNDKTKKQIIKTDNSSNINKYGLLTYIEEVDTNKKHNLQTIADNKLNELNKLKTEISLKMLGDENMHKGIIMPINQTDLNLNDFYLIKSSKHSITDKGENVEVTLIHQE